MTRRAPAEGTTPDPSAGPTGQLVGRTRLTVEVVRPDGLAWSGTARSVVVPSVEGAFGVLPGHQPVAALLTTGAVHVQPGTGTGTGERITLSVQGGFVFVQDDVVTVLDSEPSPPPRSIEASEYTQK